MRIDQALVKFFGIDSRTKAQDLIAKNLVSIQRNNNTIVITKPSFEVNENEISHIVMAEHEEFRYVSRAGIKLEGALERIGLNVFEFTALDVGQSTGGFTDCLLQKGARKIIGLDVGHGQLHPKLLNQPNVFAFEGVNVKEITLNQNLMTHLKDQVDLIVIDVSFISLKKVIPFVTSFLKNSGHCLFLVKPQFECGPQLLDKNGVLKDSEFYKFLEQDLKDFFLNDLNLKVCDYFESSILGKDGNKEFFIYALKK